MESTIKPPSEGRFRTGKKLQRRGTKHVKSGCKTCKSGFLILTKTTEGDADYMYLESEGSNATKHDLPAGSVLRQAGPAMVTVSGAQVVVLVHLKDIMNGNIPKT